MAKQLNVNLAFKADTSEAKAQLQELQRSLSALMTSVTKTTNGLGITKDIAEATNEVAKLQAMLEQSKSATGGLDLGKFNQSLKQGKMQISDYAKTLSSLGPAGDQAFAQLAKSVIHAEVPLKRTNTLLNGFKTTLANTARWQISSSILHGFMGSVQQAFGYAQDLNESLNNIRIVTGQNTEQMAAFAREANKAAQALSTTTTEYTNASLIFFQQGLNEQQVKERTDITIKLAQAAGQSVEQTSDQLTAVWNNFAENGIQPLEHYADAMTKLGAVTASSVDEIAGGLEKFASIGPMIGLSFDSAAAALATITATTRQSEDVVGTALKTIFARIQGLNLGETLDDGTTLNKYSAALQAVGISIKDQNGELKAMDDILAEMGSKWETLNKDQQVALAQTVAGVRQYNQLVSLMDNFDFYEQNLLTAQTSDGALNDAANIYAESWEAARDRVTAAAEEIYNQLLNDEFFIDLNNGFAGFLNILSNTIDGLGGLPGVLLVASSLMMKLFGKDMATAIDNWGYNIKLRSKEGIQDILNMRQKAVESLKTMYADNIDTGPTNSVSAMAFEADANLADQLLVKEQELLAKGTALTAEKKQEAQYMIQITEQFGQQAIQSAKLLEKTEQQGNELEQQLKNQIRRHNANIPEGGSKIDYKKDIAPQIQSAKQLQVQYSALESAFNKLKAAQSKGLSTETIIQELERMSTEAENAGLDVTSFKTALANLNAGMDVKAALDSIETDMYQIGDAAFEASDEIRTALSGAGMSGQQVDAILDQLYNSWVQQGIITAEVAEKLKNVSIQAEAAGKKIAEMQGPPPTLGQKIVAVGNLLSNVAMSVNAIKGLFDTWNNEDMSFGDKLISTFTTLGMVIPMVASSFSKNNVAMLGSASTSLLAAAGFDTAGISATIAAGGVGALWAALWPIALVAAAVTVAIVILVAAINAISDAYNKDALAAERAEESAHNLADAYNTAKTEYEEMISAMEAYSSARDGLDSLTEGTEAYASALKEANRLALELINTYGLIAGQDYNWEGDKLVINDEALKRTQKAKEAEVDQAYATSQMANIQAKAARNQSDKTDLIRSVQDQNGVGTGDRVLGGIINGITAGLGVVLAPVTGGLSLVATGLAAANAINADVRAAELDAAINAATEEYRENANLFDTKEAMAEELNIDDEDLINALWSNKDAIISLGNDMNAAEAAFELAAQNSANEILSNNDTVQNSKNADEVTAAGGKIYGNAYKDAYDDYLSKASDRGMFNTGTEDSKQMMKEYAAIAKLDQLKGYEVTNYTGDGTVEYEYIDDEGKRQVKEVTAEEIAATLAAAKAAEDLAGAAERLTQEFNNLDASGKAYDQALKGFLSTGNFESATREEATSLLKEAGGDDGVSKEEATSYLGSRFGTDGILTDEDAKAYGYASAQAMIDAFYEEAQNIGTAWESIKLPDNLLGLDNLSLETAQALENAFDKMNIGPLGEKAGQEFTNGLNKMIGELDAEKQQQALAALANIDWSSWDALEQADLIMQQFGVDIDTSSQEWIDFAKNMRIANGATPDFTGLKDTLIEISGILSDLEFGDIIDDEDYQKLIAYNDEWERFFILQADGSRKFIGNSEDMLAQTRANIEAQRQELKTRQEMQEGFDNAEWGYTDESGNRVTDEAKVWKDRKGSDTVTATNLMNAEGDSTAAMLETLGYTDERIQEMIDQANSEDAKIKATGEAALAQMYKAIYNFSQEDLEAMESDLDEMMASTANSFEELNKLVSEGALEQSSEAYGKQLQYLTGVGAEAAESLDDLNEVWDEAGQLAKEAGVELDPKVYEENAKRIVEANATNAKSIEDLNKIRQEAKDEAGIELDTEVYEENVKRLAEESVKAAGSLNELESAWAEALGTGVKLDYNIYAEGLLNLAEKYTICADEAKKFEQALSSGDEAQVKAAEEALEATIMLGEASEKYGVAQEELSIQSRQLAKEYGLTAKEAANLTIQNQRMNKGVADLFDNWADWKKELKATDKTTTDWAKAAAGCTKAIANLVGASEDLELPEDFFDSVDNLQLLEDAANGSEDAINKLGLKIAEVQVQAYSFSEGMKDASGNLIDESTFTTWQNTILDGITNLQSALDGLKIGTDVYEQLGGDDWVTALNEMAVATGMSVDQMNSLLNSMGVQAKVDVVDVPQKMKVPTYTEMMEPTEVTVYDSEGTPHTRFSWSKYTIPGPSKEVDGVVQVAQISTEGGDTGKPEIKFTGNGSVSGSSTGKPSGGGGNKTKPAEKERYHTVNKRIDKLNRDKDRVAADKDDAFGLAKLKHIDAEIAAIEKLKDAYEDYYQEAKNAETADRLELENYLKTLGHSLNIEDGIILNWDQIIDAEKKAFDDAIGTTNEEAAKERWDKVNELIKKYEDSVEAVRDAEDKRQEAERERISKELEKITTEVDFKIEIDDRDLDRLDYIVDKLGRNLNTMVEQIDKLGEKVDNYSTQSAAYADGINRIRQNAINENRPLTDEEVRQIWAYQDGLLEINKSLMDLVETVENSIMEEFERLSEEIDDNIGRFDAYSETLDHFQNILKLSGRTVKDSALILDLAARKTDMAMKKLNATNDKYKAQQDSLANIKEKLDEAKKSGDQDDIDYWQEQYDKQVKIVEETHNEMLQSWEDVLQAASDQFDLEIETTIQTLKDSISEFGLDGLADRYDKAAEAQDRYLSKLDKEYELNKMNRDIQSKIDDTDNIAAKQKLLELQDEINAKLASGEEMSRYDLEHLQKKYELELAKIALEEAQNAKSTVRLSRDSEGNFGYVYTADEDKVADAEQNYEDKLYELKSHSEEYLDEMSQKIIENQEEMMEALAAVDKTKFDTQAEYEAELDRIKEYYMGRDKYYRGEMQKAMDELGITYQDTILGQIEGSESLDAAQQKLETNTNTATTQMGQAWKDWKDTVDQSATEAGTSSETMTQDITDDAEEISQAGEDLAEDIDTQTSKMKTYIDGLIQKVHEWRENYIDDIEQMIAANEKLAMSENPEVPETETPQETQEETETEKPETKTQKISHSDMVQLVVDMGQGDYGNGSARRKAVEAKYPGICSIAQGILNQAIREDEYNYRHNGNKWKSQTVDRLVSAAGYDTGGFTGEWGPEGKLAFLHEKEIVLNKNDTENLLKTITFIREIISMIDSQANMSSMFNLSASSGVMAGNELLEQIVTIHAEFPNATNHSEIEEAFNNLVNRASQYANRK